MIRKILYSKLILQANLFILNIFFERKYLKGKYFYEKRAGLLWGWKSVFRKIFGNNRGIPFPVGASCIVSNSRNLEFDVDSINVFQSPGCYFQNHRGKIYIGKKVYIAPNVGLITTNHDITDLDKHIEGKDIKIGDECWIGMNSVILPGVELGKKTIVGAGAVVTKSFIDGNCIIGGVPAKVIRNI
ncbi:MAG: acyltransferase [Sarcina sp.]